MEAEILQLVQQHPAYAYLVVFGVLLACGLGVPLPEDITLIAGGYTVYLAHQHGLSSPQLIPMIVVGFFGVLTGDVVLFSLGRWLGPRATRIWPFRKILSPKRMRRARRFFRQYGAWTAFIARFAAGLRAPFFLLAGSMGMRRRTFIIADGAAALISVPLLVWASWRFGAHLDRVKVWLLQSKYALATLIVGLLLYVGIKALIQRRRDRRAAAEEEGAPPPAAEPAEPAGGAAQGDGGAERQN